MHVPPFLARIRSFVLLVPCVHGCFAGIQEVQSQSAVLVASAGTAVIATLAQYTTTHTWSVPAHLPIGTYVLVTRLQASIIGGFSDSFCYTALV